MYISYNALPPVERETKGRPAGHAISTHTKQESQLCPRPNSRVGLTHHATTSPSSHAQAGQDTRPHWHSQICLPQRRRTLPLSHLRVQGKRMLHTNSIAKYTNHDTHHVILVKDALLVTCDTPMVTRSSLYALCESRTFIYFTEFPEFAHNSWSRGWLRAWRKPCLELFLCDLAQKRATVWASR